MDRIVHAAHILTFVIQFIKVLFAPWQELGKCKISKLDAQLTLILLLLAQFQLFVPQDQGYTRTPNVVAAHFQLQNVVQILLFSKLLVLNIAIGILSYLKV